MTKPTAAEYKAALIQLWEWAQSAQAYVPPHLEAFRAEGQKALKAAQMVLIRPVMPPGFATAAQETGEEQDA